MAAQAGGSGTVTGSVGTGRYAARVNGRQVIAIGEAPRALGAPARAAVTATLGPGGVEPGSWRQVPPAQYVSLLDGKKP